jgi:KaiC/GvpD/RAD55 family RecA-like ATPase
MSGTVVKRKPLTLAERARRLAGRCPRLRTGWPTLDRATRGGLPLGTLVVLAGPPGVGKTGVALALIHRLVTAQGAIASVLASDEPADGLLTRLAQLEGFDRTAVEDGYDGVRASLAEHVAHLPIDLLDADEDDAFIEDAAGQLARRADGRADGRPVLFVDSIQTSRQRTEAAGADPRARVDAVVRALKRARATAGGTLVLASSEASRGLYNKSPAEQTNALAAGKESSGIEYGATVLLVLTSTSDPGRVKVEIAKNRTGTRGCFELVADSERASYREPEYQPAAREAEGDEEADAAVLGTLRSAGAPVGKDKLVQSSGIRATRARAAVGRLLAAQVVVEVAGGLDLAGRDATVPGRLGTDPGRSEPSDRPATKSAPSQPSRRDATEKQAPSRRPPTGGVPLRDGTSASRAIEASPLSSAREAVPS